MTHSGDYQSPLQTKTATRLGDDFIVNTQPLLAAWVADRKRGKFSLRSDSVVFVNSFEAIVFRKHIAESTINQNYTIAVF